MHISHELYLLSVFVERAMVIYSTTFGTRKK
jgi:hypothetical protein